MPVLPVRLFGDPVLTTPAEQVTAFGAELRRLVRNLDETLYDQRGSGLAAPQVGVGLRVFVFHEEDVAGHLVNPVLDFPDQEEQDGPEGCLSMPGLYFDTKRRMNVVAKGFTGQRRSRPGGRRRPSGPLPAARDRPCRRRAVHRPPGPRTPQGGHAGDPRGRVERPCAAAGEDQPAPDDQRLSLTMPAASSPIYRPGRG